MFKVNGSLLLCTILLENILIYEHIKDNSKVLITKVVLLKCKQW